MSFLSSNDEINVIDFLFDTHTPNQTIHVTEEGKRAIQKKIFGGTMTILGDKPLSERGNSSFTIHIESIGMKGLWIGVAEIEFDIRKIIGKDDSSWALHSNGKTYYDNNAQQYSVDLKAKTTVTLTLKRAEGAIYFSIDGVDYGRAFMHPKLETA